MIIRPSLIRYSVDKNKLQYWIDTDSEPELLAAVELSDEAVQELADQPDAKPFNLVRLLMTPHGHIKLIAYFATVCSDVVKSGSASEGQLEALKMLCAEAHNMVGLGHE